MANILFDLGYMYNMNMPFVLLINFNNTKAWACQVVKKVFMP